MKTGDGGMDLAAIESAAVDVFLPVMESATVLAAHYTQACGRDVVTAQDMRLGLMYAARNVTGKQVGTLFPEIYEEDEEDDDDESWETVSDAELEWTRYEGTDDVTALKMNECAETWDSWEPETPAERAIKNAVDKQNQEKTV
jgi:hypothetical protein